MIKRAPIGELIYHPFWSAIFTARPRPAATMDHKTARMAEMCRHLQFLKSDNPCSQAHVDFCPLLYTPTIFFGLI